MSFVVLFKTMSYHGWSGTQNLPTLVSRWLGLHVCTNTGTSFISEIEMTNLRNMIIRGMVSAKVRRAQQAWKWQNDDNDKKKKSSPKKQ